MEPNPARPLRPRPRRLAIWEICVLIAGVAVGVWLIGSDPGNREDVPYRLWIGLLGGGSVVGPPLLLWERRRRKGRWGPGEILWFSSGASAWLLWPPVVVAGPATVRPGRPWGASPTGRP